MLASSNNGSHHRRNGDASNAEQDTREILRIGRNDFQENTDVSRGSKKSRLCLLEIGTQTSRSRT